MAAARRAYEAANLAFVAGRAEQMPFRDGAFDLVVAPLVLHYVEDWRALFAELRRVLRPGGVARMLIHHKDSEITRAALVAREVLSSGGTAVDAAIAGAFAMGLLGLLLYFFVDWLEKRLCPWKFAT